MGDYRTRTAMPFWEDPACSPSAVSDFLDGAIKVLNEFSDEFIQSRVDAWKEADKAFSAYLEAHPEMKMDLITGSFKTETVSELYNAPDDDIDNMILADGVPAEYEECLPKVKAVIYEFGRCRI